MNDPKWKRFERLVYEIQKDLARDGQVTLNDSIQGEDSKSKRQIDISVRSRVGQYSLLIVIDCKDYAAPVDVKDVGEFITVVRDVRANKGAIVSNSGFTSGAIELAKTHRIDTFSLVDTESSDWQTYLALPALLERTWISQFAFNLRGQLPGGTIIRGLGDSDPRYLRVFSADGQPLGILLDILARAWNEQRISHEPGDREESLAENVELEVGDQRLAFAVAARVIVSRTYYFGHLPIHTRGLTDEQDGALITREFQTDQISPFEIEQGRVSGWERVDDPATIAVRPVLRLGYNDLLPTSE